MRLRTALLARWRLDAALDAFIAANGGETTTERVRSDLDSRARRGFC